MFSLAKARRSQWWKAINDLSTLQWLVVAVLGLAVAIGAWFRRQPLYIGIFWFIAATAVSATAIHRGLLLRDRIRAYKKLHVENTAVPPPPNLVFQTPQMSALRLEGEVWTRGPSPNSLGYLSWIVPIKNEVIPGKAVGKADGVRAEIIVSTGGQLLCQWSPAVWVGEKTKVVEIPVTETRAVVIAVKSSLPGGYWEIESKGIPLGTRIGELKIRLLREDIHGTATLLTTKFYKWKRAPELFDFYIESI